MTIAPANSAAEAVWAGSSRSPIQPFNTPLRSYQLLSTDGCRTSAPHWDSRHPSPCLAADLPTRQSPQPQMHNCKGYAELQNYKTRFKTPFPRGLLLVTPFTLQINLCTFKPKLYSGGYDGERLRSQPLEGRTGRAVVQSYSRLHREFEASLCQETPSQVSWSVAAKACCLSQLRGVVGRGVYYLVISQAFFPQGQENCTAPKELSEVLSVNGSIYIAINPLSGRTAP